MEVAALERQEQAKKPKNGLPITELFKYSKLFVCYWENCPTKQAALPLKIDLQRIWGKLHLKRDGTPKHELIWIFNF